ncbi:MAG: hypothetical protein WCY27_00360 [archaeon]|jgi:hypothetical protein|nr:hypothetical protein [archaeon]MDD2477650.1 hypothetical protein [Candidatus ainarchaeum sp.]MDD3084376.1 hypothetical protein [Candidatus ainarchaeum sp.]MDD4220832.1 hypothetical protein [Candidatus ainarchaeum sp.]MDD4662332.1 hypothetical protein [Candidatus ainarchaeum sp.]
MPILKKLLQKKKIKRLRKLHEYKEIKDDVDFVSKKILHLLIDCEALISSTYFFERKEDIKKELINLDSKKEPSFKKKILHINQKSIDLINNFEIIYNMFFDLKQKLENTPKKQYSGEEIKKINLQYTQLESKIDLIKRFRKISNIVFKED